MPKQPLGFGLRGTPSKRNAVMRTIARIFVALFLVWPLGPGQAAERAFETVNTLRGELPSPYTDVAKVAKEGHRNYLSHEGH
jgi:hypothetical protein